MAATFFAKRGKKEAQGGGENEGEKEAKRQQAIGDAVKLIQSLPGKEIRRNRAEIQRRASTESHAT